jgi:hypothetical protein
MSPSLSRDEDEQQGRREWGRLSGKGRRGGLPGDARAWIHAGEGRRALIHAEESAAGGDAAPEDEPPGDASQLRTNRRGGAPPGSDPRRGGAPPGFDARRGGAPPGRCAAGCNPSSSSRELVGHDVLFGKKRTVIFITSGSG